VKKSIIAICLLMTIVMDLKAFDYEFRFTNDIYDPYIKTVTLETNDLPTNFPVIRKGSGDYIMLKFDDLLNEERNYYYKIIHCDKDWTPSKLSELEAIGGFNDERLRSFQYSVNTKTQYIHYWQKFPNKDTYFKVSGNFLLVIYEDKLDYPVLSRRFIVTEKAVTVSLQSVFPRDVANIRYKQEFQVEINFQNFKMRNPVEEITLMMLQNDNWETAMLAQPSFFSSNVLRFNKVRSFEFWGLNEYREFDTRSLFSLGRGIANIERNINNIDVFLKLEQSRRTKPYIFIFDFNGKFFIDNFDGAQGNSITNLLSSVTNSLNNTNTNTQLRNEIISQISSNQVSNVQGFQEKNIRGDYANVVFNLENDDLEPDDEIYLLGAFNNWTPSKEFQLYNRGKNLYTLDVNMKQGYYNYMYGKLLPDGKIDYMSLEGSWQDTENEYQAIVYYRGIGDLYDRIISYNTYNTEVNIANR